MFCATICASSSQLITGVLAGCKNDSHTLSCPLWLCTCLVAYLFKLKTKTTTTLSHKIWAPWSFRSPRNKSSLYFLVTKEIYRWNPCNKLENRSGELARLPRLAMLTCPYCSGPYSSEAAKQGAVQGGCPWILPLPLTGAVNLGKLLHRSVPQFPLM